MLNKVIPLLIVCGALQGCASAIVAGTVTAVASANDPRSIGVQIDDSAIELKAVLELLKDDGINDHTNLSVVSYNGVVLVVGQSPNQFLIDNALKILRGINGVKKVHNQIRIGTPASITTKTKDTWITTRVKSDLLTDDDVKGHKVKVVTESSVVYLMGIMSAKDAQKAATIAANVDGVAQVVTVFENK